MTEHLSTGISSDMLMDQIHAQTFVQRPEQDTAVWDKHPQIQYAVEQVLYPYFESEENTSVIFAAAGEPGSGKGTILAQGNAHIESDMVLEGKLEARNRSLARHYVSTSSAVHYGISQGLQKSEYGNPTPDEIADITKLADTVLITAEEMLPKMRPDETHLFYQEWVGVSERLDVGTSVIKRLGKMPNSLVIFVVSNPTIQERGYALRHKLREEANDYDAILKGHNSVLDMEGRDARTTMGTDKSIEFVCTSMNKEMYTSYREGEIDISETAPYDLRRDFEMDINKTNNVELFFTSLTRFENGKMITHPIRPYLQEMHYRTLIDKWQLRSENCRVFPMEFIDEDIYGFPQELKNVALDWNLFAHNHDSLQSNTR